MIDYQQMGICFSVELLNWSLICVWM